MKRHCAIRAAALAVGIGLACAPTLPFVGTHDSALAPWAAAQPAAPHAGHAPSAPGRAIVRSPAALPPPPANLPAWMGDKRRNHRFYKRGAYNFDIYNVRPLARDLNAIAVGHAMAYEDLVTGKSATLETKTFDRINRVLHNPPALMPDEGNISPTFGRRYGALEQLFEWTHVLHAQTVDVLASTRLTPEEKDREIGRLWEFYSRAPYAITPLPMNMEYLDGQPYSGAFRARYPKVNGLFWGYHWLQGAMYDLLYRTPLTAQRAAYAVVGERYHKVELYRTDREFMPMFAETSPEFAARFPAVANAFDNLHMLHDMVNDILASEWISEKRKEEQIARAIWMVLATTHAGEKPGARASADPLHDHRFAHGMPGMGMMKGSTEELMYMAGMGWMRMGDCAHCSMPLPAGEDSWQAPTLFAEGWGMRVRCALCARDMAAQTRGRAIVRLATEDPWQKLVLISDEQGNWSTETPGALFLEEENGHAGCARWSRAFTSRAAFDAYVAANPRYAGSRPLTLAEWSEREGKKPDTYVKPKGPVENPYRSSAPGGSH
jgi:hypothetical protein